MYVYGSSTEQIAQGICPAGIVVKVDDQDKDGITDSCDGFIDKEPEVIVPVEPPSTDTETEPVVPDSPTPSTDPESEVIIPVDPSSLDPENTTTTNPIGIDSEDLTQEIGNNSEQQLQSISSIGQESSLSNNATTYDNYSTVLNQSVDSSDSFAALNHAEIIPDSNSSDPIRANSSGSTFWSKLVIFPILAACGILMLFVRRRRSTCRIN